MVLRLNGILSCHVNDGEKPSHHCDLTDSLSHPVKRSQFAEAILQRDLKPNEEFAPAQLYSELCDLVVTGDNTRQWQSREPH